MTKTAVYRVYNVRGALLYIGVSNNPQRRMWEHSSRAEWAAFIARTDVEWHDTREAALDVEREAIRLERPAHNVANDRSGVERQLARIAAAPLPDAEAALVPVLRFWLRDNHISHLAAAGALGVSRSYLSEIINGQKSPSLRVAVLIEDFTLGEVSVRQLADFFDAQSARACHRKASA